MAARRAVGTLKARAHLEGDVSGGPEDADAALGTCNVELVGLVALPHGLPNDRFRGKRHSDLSGTAYPLAPKLGLLRLGAAAACAARAPQASMGGSRPKVLRGSEASHLSVLDLGA